MTPLPCLTYSSFTNMSQVAYGAVGLDSEECCVAGPNSHSDWTMERNSTHADKTVLCNPTDVPWTWIQDIQHNKCAPSTENWNMETGNEKPERWVCVNIARTMERACADIRQRKFTWLELSIIPKIRLISKFTLLWMKVSLPVIPKCDILFQNCIIS